MEKRPTKCPLCGDRIIKVTNATTKNSYFKCANEKCNFVLGENFTEAEFYLQGQPLQTKCIKCGEELTITNGPHGLYPRCYSCNCDLRPTMYNGKMYQKWVNAQRDSAKNEIKALVESFNNHSSHDELYDFETYIASTPAKKSVKSKEDQAEDTNCTKILSYLAQNMSRPIGSEEISKFTNVKIGSVRTSLLSLRTLGLVKIVDYIPNPTGNHTLLYQVTESDLEEVKTYSKKDGYNTIASFLKENVDKYGSVIRAKDVLTASLRDNKVPSVLFHSTRGICSGYPVSVMEKIMNKQPLQTTMKFEEEEKISHTPLYRGREEMKKEILNILQQNLRTPYTLSQMAQYIKANKSYVKGIIKDLRKAKKLKVVGWDYKKGQPGATALKYQLSESPLPKFKTTVDNNLYVTFKQFYRRKLSGKRATSMAKAESAIKDLPIIPLIINQRAYVGYSMNDLKEVFQEYMESPISKKSPKKIQRVVKVPSKVNTKTVTTISERKEVSNPISKKSFFSSITSLFQRKEKVHS